MMIEVLTKRRIAVFAVFLALFTIAGLLLRSHWEYTRLLAIQEAQIRSKAKKASSCANYTSLSQCQRCPKEELRQLVPYCMQTGHKELIRCDNGKEEFIWCDISPAIEERDFWKFQICTLVLGLSSYTVVYLRQKKLDKILMEKINRQIASGV
ncbi:protein JTB-like [Physella acuta]|uniref:protein JTB-like n=1 Tax=Physella acuta TaxID=109671 RepID=UPI0027DCDF15|nr:protein JTB-like [Physella acuta]